MQVGEKRGGSAVVVAALTAAFVIAQQVAGKATRDALFLSHHSPTELPAVMAVAAVLSLVIVLAMGSVLPRWSPPRVVAVASMASAVFFAAEWLLADRFPRGIATLVYLHTASLGAALVSGFWSCINERFDPHTARRVIGTIAGGAAFGGVAGGGLAWGIGTALSLPWMLATLAVLSVACAVGVIVSGGPRTPTREDEGAAAAASGLRAMRRVPYLRHLALMVALIAIADASIDYVFKARASASFHGGDSLIAFFAIFYTVTAIATFVIQSVFAHRALERFGLTGTVAALPGALAIGSGLAVVAPGLWTIGGVRGVGAALASSLYRSGYELLYTPLAPAQKRGSKVLIDVGFDRIGGALGSGLAMLVIAIVPTATSLLLLGTAAVTAAVCVLLSGLLHTGYVAALADGLRRGAVALDAHDVRDMVTRNTLADTAMAIDRERLVAELTQLRGRLGDDLASEPPEIDSAPAATSESPASSTSDPLLSAISSLRSRDADKIREVLHSGPLQLELVPHVVPLLGRNDLHAEAAARLTEVIDKITGELIDGLLDRHTPFAVRRRIPRLLGAGSGQRAVDGLIAGLADDRFEVRYRCATALHQIKRVHPELSISSVAVFAGARREAAVGEHVWKSHRLLDGTSLDEEVLSGDAARTLGRNLEHVFNLLALALDREPLTLAFRALGSQDDRLRGTGLEYLENVLPADIREALWPYLGARRRPAGTARQREQIVSDLLISFGQLPTPVTERES
jgi:ATP/ADP translocase